MELPEPEMLAALTFEEALQEEARLTYVAKALTEEAKQAAREAQYKFAAAAQVRADLAQMAVRVEYLRNEGEQK